MQLDKLKECRQLMVKGAKKNRDLISLVKKTARDDKKRINCRYLCGCAKCEDFHFFSPDSVSLVFFIVIVENLCATHNIG